MGYRLGKKPAKRDTRNFQLKNIMRVGAVPSSFDCDDKLSVKVPLKMFANDKWGDCVIAGRAHQTLRFEGFEQKKALPIMDIEVLLEYWKEQGGDAESQPDGGLVILDSLNKWRQLGWVTGNKTYNIYAFAEIDRTNHAELQSGVINLNGAYAGLLLSTSAKCQFAWYMRWDVAAKNNEPGTLGGHCVYIVGWDSKGPICITWGRKQKMTWAFWDKYCDEAYCIVDNKDSFVINSPVNVEKLDGYLKALG